MSERGRISIVIGAGFGDEGKGRVVSELIARDKSPFVSKLVVRFNGGHQAGHTVCVGEHRHVCSSVGSGVLQGVPTFWGPRALWYPTGLRREMVALYEKLGKWPRVRFHPDSPITTPFEIAAQRDNRENFAHGSVGVGIRPTVVREERGITLRARDLFGHLEQFKAKVRGLAEFYRRWDLDLTEFFADCAWVIEHCLKCSLDDTPSLADKHLIFEGAQGLGLDAEYGVFPNVTPSRCGPRWALEMIRDLPEARHADITIYLVTRPYLTRHGPGWVPNTYPAPALLNAEEETNVLNEWQGAFRKNLFDRPWFEHNLVLVNREVREFTDELGPIPVVPVLTCADQMGEEWEWVDKWGVRRNAPKAEFLKECCGFPMVLSGPRAGECGASK